MARPEDGGLLKKAQEINLEVLSITDHDSVKSYFEIQKNKELQNQIKNMLVEQKTKKLV